jgi:hypothetical protein
MSVLHLEDSDCSYLAPVQAAIVFDWWGLFHRFEQQPVRTIQVHREHALEIGSQLVTATRKRSHGIKILYGAQLIQTPPEKLGALLTQLLEHVATRVAELLDPLRREEYLHPTAYIKDR